MNGEAIFAAAAPELPPGVPNEIQWAPPGVHTITATQGGKPTTTTVTVDATSAAAVQNDLARYIAQAKAGGGDLPFIDFNHDDKEASGHPSEAYWGGSDPKAGGVRLKLAWTEAGAAAVRGRMYRRFSPSFYVKNGAIVGTPINCGGVVNRAAFTSIAPLVTSADLLAAKAVSETISSIGNDHDFVNAGKLIATQRGLSDDEAFEVLAKEDPDAYLIYNASLGLGRTGSLKPRREPVVYTEEANALLDIADAIAAKYGADPGDALSVLAGASSEGYAAYRASLSLGSNDFQEKQKTFAHPYFKKVSEIAEQHGTSDSHAGTVVRKMWPELWESYKNALTGPSAEQIIEKLTAKSGGGAGELDEQVQSRSEADPPLDYDAYRASLGLGRSM